jgi:hypothetical protein
MNQCARNFIGAVALAFLLIPFNARANEKPIGILLAAGDIAVCPKDDDKDKDTRNGKATAGLIKQEIDDATVKYPGVEVRILALGDLAYNCGATGGFKCFDESWGQFKNLLLPVPGNHEYDPKRGEPPNEKCVKDSEKKPGEDHAKPYFKYFEDNEFAKQTEPLYSLRFPDREKGPWLLIGLNPYAGLSAATLKTLLDKETSMHCVLAFSHAALYSSGRHGHGQNSNINLSSPLVPLSGYKAIYETLHNARASVIVAGHDHHYEQLGRANAKGTAAKNGKAAMVKDGVRSFIVGTGGTHLHSEGKIGNKLKNDYENAWAFREAYDLQNYGILKIKLYPDHYEWEFIPTQPAAASMVVIRDVKKDDCNRT